MYDTTFSTTPRESSLSTPVLAQVERHRLLQRREAKQSRRLAPLGCMTLLLIASCSLCVLFPTIAGVITRGEPPFMWHWQEWDLTLSWPDLAAIGLGLVALLVIALIIALLRRARSGLSTLRIGVWSWTRALLAVVLWPLSVWLALGRWILNRQQSRQMYKDQDSAPPILLANEPA